MEASDPLLVTRATMAAAIRSLFGCWTLAAVLRHAPKNTPASDLREYAGSAMEGSTLLFEIPSLLDDETALMALLCDRLASPTAPGVLDAIRADQPRADLAQITFAALRLDDVHRLSRRDSTLKDVYDMPTERAFERQLSLLFMSLGFAVIESTPGKRYVDLLCIADTPEPATIVVEAKSTAAGEYKFPAADQRALVEHVTGVRRTLRSLATASPRGNCRAALLSGRWPSDRGCLARNRCGLPWTSSRSSYGSPQQLPWPTSVQRHARESS